MKTSIQFFFSFLLVFLPCFSQAQKELKVKKTYQISAQKVSEKVHIDGELNEKIWQTAVRADDFFQTFPYDSSLALSKTEAMVAFDDHFLYVAAYCYDDLPGDYVVQSLRRDFDGGVNDFFALYLDTFGDQTNGFAFGVSPMGVQREGLISDGGSNDLNLDWDNKWFAGAKIHKGFYTVELAIPFKTLRFNENLNSWRINFARIDRKRNEISSWVPVPRNFRVTTLAFTGDLMWESPLQKSGANVSLIPYVSGGSSRDYLAESPTKNTANVGLDAKIAVTSSLNLDLTFNPDFSQVEVDRQVTNLERFEIFFPERRQFFLENQDLFARFGFPDSRPFFSRRVGIARDKNTGLIVLNPIIYGARLSGKIDKDWRVGLLNMQSARKPAAGIEGQNYTVAALQRRVFTRSVLGGVFINRQRTSGEGQAFSLGIRDFERIVGLEYNLNSKDNKWTGEAYYHRLFRPNNQAEQMASGLYLGYSDPNWEIAFGGQYIGKNYAVNNIGFVPRTNYTAIFPQIGHKFYPKKPNAKVNNHGPNFESNFYWLNDTRRLTDANAELGYLVNFNSGAFLGAFVGKSYTYLFFDFDPTNTNGKKLLAGTDYLNTGGYLRYESNPRKLFAFNQGIGYQSYFNGNLFVLEGDLAYRFQPIANIALSYTFNQIHLPKDYNSANLFLVGPRFDFTFTRNVFMTLFTQYNNQINNVNLNARFQWRFRPVSDLFIVYTDNYFATSASMFNESNQQMRNFQPFQVKNRALVVKLTYWLNL